MMGNALIGRLFYSLCKHKVPILFDAPIVDLTGDRRGVKGARLNIGGKEILVKTRKGVVLATGGYAHNKRFREAFMPQPVPEYSMSYDGNHGDGVDIGQRLGAADRARAMHQWAVDARVNCAAERRHQGPVSASCA